jgi:hypothetical protein
MAALPARLTDPWFEAEFYGEVAHDDSWRIAHEDGSPMTFNEAQGLFIWCPCGYGVLDADGNERYPLDLSLNRGRPHGVLIPFANPPSGIPLPPEHGPVSNNDSSHPRWTVSGTSLHDLTITPSVVVGKNPGCWHGFIRNGDITNA